MQKPLNARERNNAFLKFLLFLLITVAMICGAVYYDFDIPHKENRLLKERVEQNRIQTMAQEKFTNKLVEVKQMMDSAGKPGVNTLYLNQVVMAKLKELTELQFIDSTIQAKMNRTVLSTYIDYNKVKTEMVNMGDAPNVIAELKSRNDQLQRDIDQLRRDLELAKKGY
jgi:uncharacterized protein HemX